MPEFLLEFPELLRLDLAGWIDSIVSWLLTNWPAFFNAIGSILLMALLSIERFLLWLPWTVIVIALGLIAWRVMRLWWAGLLMAVFLVLIGSFGYWEQSMITLSVIITAVILSLAIGLPTGIIMARSNTIEAVLRPILDTMQTIPSFVYLIPALILFGLGVVPAVFATVIYAIPPVIRLTNVGIRQVPQSVTEAAQAFGSSGRQVLFEVQLPLALPAIMVGINQTTMMALAMAVIASMIGARGLGQELVQAIIHVEAGRGFQAGVSIILLAIIIDRLTHALVSRQEYKITS